MSRLHVDHKDIVNFADERVNLKKDDVTHLREQAKRLRDRLEAYLKEHPDFSLRKMMLSGSLAKGTALKSIDDIDIGVYISIADVPENNDELIPWLAIKLRQAFPNFKPEQVIENPFTVTVLFSGTGLKVDVVPIIYEGDPDWKGHLVSKDTGERVLTSIPMHLEFIRKRKIDQNGHYTQIIRLLKYWVKNMKLNDSEFRFKSFMIELLVAHLVDAGLQLNDYPEALAEIFAHIAKDGFQSSISFQDYYNPSICPAVTDPIKIWDPVNHENNTASRYTIQQRDTIIEAALDAGDAVDSALCATTKDDTLRYWRKIFGTTFNA